MSDNLEQLKNNLIVSCQALPHEPLHSSFIMGRMARAAKEGGAVGIRANTKEDIEEIQKNVDLPIIGIVKRDYENCDVYITPTMKEIDELMEVKPEIIALDATSSLRPNGVTLDEFYKEIRKKYPNQKLMADCSTVEEAIHADKLGFDFIGTTLVGYTKQSKDSKIEENDFEILREIISKVSNKVIAEGNIDTPEKAKRVLELGSYSVVVGSIITRPQNITKRFSDAIGELIISIGN
ncbi:MULTISPECIES: N-acetylmannosamine-6-phosphate 2-epimerase [unclassified Romboutsia]|uniref:N-acetylmannosamine-6-phosphate 2-epimerase n=1 Tax=unclassified Romboutsia TaxID=2626894 RepID=UPI00082340B1|nr:MULTISPECIES: N-acetylmannosamine-6-phosphate 2-epimerase [unclassified Romboutsia]SCI02745.1 Putative N-acetylmannosamine-6-phosphate 2-epimerase [uncultured Clostridium sp.]